MSASWNLPPGVTPRMIDGPRDVRSLLTQLNDFMREHREIPDTNEVRHYVLRELVDTGGEPDPDEVLAWIERQVERGSATPGTRPNIQVWRCLHCNTVQGRKSLRGGVGCSFCGREDAFVPDYWQFTVDSLPV